MRLIEIALFGYGIAISGFIGFCPEYGVEAYNGFEWKLKKFYSCPYIKFKVYKTRLIIRILLKGYS